MYLGDELVTVMTVDVQEGRIRRLFLIRNPDKLPRAPAK
jgi:hypothetical protein